MKKVMIEDKEDLYGQLIVIIVNRINFLNYINCDVNFIFSEEVVFYLIQVRKDYSSN